MSNFHLRDKNLSLKAKGLLSWMLSNNDDWDYSIAGIVACCKEGETTINTTLKELQNNGYVEVKKIMPNKESNRIHYEYFVYEYPQGVESLGLESQGVESQGVESQGQINTNKINTNKIITNKNNNNIRFKPPTLEELNEYIAENNLNVDAKQFIDYYESNGWKVGRNPMKDWKATVRRWHRTNGDKRKYQSAMSEDNSRDLKQLRTIEEMYLKGDIR
jgi:hypothetical protein